MDSRRKMADTLRIMGRAAPGDIVKADDVAAEMGLPRTALYRQLQQAADRLGLEVLMAGRMWRVPGQEQRPALAVVQRLANGALLLEDTDGSVWWAKRLVEA